jgi:NAD(P)-dependent dehydrogenase (short-subunit alcohol dehydrogenase family)
VIAGRTALVTGGSAGIGKQIVLELARAGVRVMATARRAAPLDELAASGAGQILGMVADMTSPDEQQRVIGEVRERLGAVDILVNNIGGGAAKPLLSLTPDDWAAGFARNLSPAVTLTTALAPAMVERGWGRVVNIASTVAREPDPIFAPYSAAKAALVSFTQAAARTLAPHGVSVNCVLPGVISTESNERLAQQSAQARDITTEEVMRRMIAKHPIPAGHVGSVNDIAGAVMFLVGDGGAWIHGACLAVDGGAHNYAF